jgi:hypothetical protein
MSVRWVGHVASMGKVRISYKILVVRGEGKNDLDDLGVDGRVILK